VVALGSGGLLAFQGLLADVVAVELDGDGEHAGGLGPDPHVFHLIYRLMPTSPDDGRPEPAPDVLDEAADYQLVTYDLDERYDPANIKLAPEVAYSLGLIDYLPEDEPRLRRGWPPTDDT